MMPHRICSTGALGLSNPEEKKCKQATETSDKPPKAKKSKYGLVSKKCTLKNVAASKAKDVPAMEPQVAAEDTDLQKDLEESMKTAYALPWGPLPPVVIGEPELGKYQPLLEVSRMGKAKVTEEQSGSEEESEKVVTGADEGGQHEGQAGPNPGAQAEGQTGSDTSAQDEGQARSNPDETSEGQAGPDPGDVGAKVQSILSPVVYDASDREHMDLNVADVSPQPSTEQLDEEFTATAYSKVQGNLKLTVEEQVFLEEPASLSGTQSSLQYLSKDISFGDLFFSDKPSVTNKNVETKVESMVNVPIQQALSSISLMTSLIIDLTSRLVSPKIDLLGVTNLVGVPIHERTIFENNGNFGKLPFHEDICSLLMSLRAVIFRDKYGVQMMMRFNEIHKFSDGTLQQIDEGLDYRFKEFRINRMNLEAFEDKADLPKPGELCWWTRQRGRLQTFEACRMIKSFRHSRPLSDDL
nr:hypothetical protein [Tanacetum cinerariifolium]